MSNLCVTCNLCCNGSLFARVPVSEAEQALLPDDVEIFLRDGNLRMRQPCSCLAADGGCTVYDVRPRTCRTFHCKLSKRVEADEIAEDTALQIIAEIKTAQTSALTLAAQAMGHPADEDAAPRIGQVFRRLKAMRKDAADQVNEFAASRALIQRDRYDRLVRKHLRSKFRGGT